MYSTFLQRGYDMLLHDIALQRLHAVFAVDRAGLVGDDGETHHGVFDVAYLDSVPGMTVLAPSSFAEAERMLERAVLTENGPVALRLPRGGEGAYTGDSADAAAVVLREGTDVTLVSYGILINRALEAAERLAQDGIRAEVVKLNTITPLDTQLVCRSVSKTGALIVAEDCVEAGSVGQRLCAALTRERIPAKTALVNSGVSFTAHGSIPQLERQLGLDGDSLYQLGKKVLGRG